MAKQPPSKVNNAMITVWVPCDLLAAFRARVAAERGVQPALRNGYSGPPEVLRALIARYVAEGEQALLAEEGAAEKLG